jgi:hypothetical protein
VPDTRRRAFGEYSRRPETDPCGGPRAVPTQLVEVLVDHQSISAAHPRQVGGRYSYAGAMRNDRELDAAIETIVVDAYGDDEQYTAFLTVFEEQATLPTTATILGTPVTVTGFDYTNDAHGVIATCHGRDGAGEVALADLIFPPDTVTAWVHAAYRRHLGLRPFPARPRSDWT